MGDSFAFGLICLVGVSYAIVPTIVVSFVRTIIFVVVTIAVAVALWPRITTAHFGIGILLGWVSCRFYEKGFLFEEAFCTT